MKTYFLFTFYAYEVKLEDGRFMDSTEISVIDKNYNSALKRVKEIIKKPYYFCKSITEYINKV
jgi:hypothetical protein